MKRMISTIETKGLEISACTFGHGSYLFWWSHSETGFSRLASVEEWVEATISGSPTSHVWGELPEPMGTRIAEGYVDPSAYFGEKRRDDFTLADAAVGDKDSHLGMCWKEGKFVPPTI